MVVFAGPRSVERCMDLVRMAASQKPRVRNRSAFGLGARVVVPRSEGLLRAAAEASLAGLLASVLRALDVRCDGARFVAEDQIEPPKAREAWVSSASSSSEPLLLLLAGAADEELVLVAPGRAGLARALERVLAWARSHDG